VDSHFAAKNHEIARQQFVVKELSEKNFREGAEKDTTTAEIYNEPGEYLVRCGPSTFAINKNSGQLTNWSLEGTEQLQSPMSDSFARAPLDNDICSSQIDHPSPDSWLSKWQAAGLFDWEHRCLDISLDESCKRLTARHGYFDNNRLMVSSTWHYVFSVDGTVAITIRVEVSESAPPLPRVGAALRLSQDPGQVSWFGRGPHENYPDRKHSAVFGQWTQSTPDMHTPYIFPSENGLRCDVSKARIGRILIEGEFSLGVSQYSVKQLMSAQHEHELIPEDGLSIHIDGFHMGVGGDDSWSPSAKPRYLLTAATYCWNFSLGPSN
jgi:beta-galactosidase